MCVAKHVSHKDYDNNNHIEHWTYNVIVVSCI